MTSSVPSSGPNQWLRHVRPEKRVDTRAPADSAVRLVGGGGTTERERHRRDRNQESARVKHHLWVLWTDYFKAPHFEKFPELNGLFNEATKLAGAGGTKGTTDVAVADKLLAKIDEIAAIFWETKK